MLVLHKKSLHTEYEHTVEEEKAMYQGVVFKATKIIQIKNKKKQLQQRNATPTPSSWCGRKRQRLRFQASARFLTRKRIGTYFLFHPGTWFRISGFSGQRKRRIHENGRPKRSRLLRFHQKNRSRLDEALESTDGTW